MPRADGVPTIEEVKDKLITITLAKTDGNRTQAAKLLGLSMTTLRREIKRRETDDEQEPRRQERNLSGPQREDYMLLRRAGIDSQTALNFVIKYGSERKR